MKPLILVDCLVMLAIAIPARAADPAPDSPPDAKPEASAEAGPKLTEPVIPKRELTFEQSAEEYPLPLNVPDPKLLEQRYIAVFRSVGLPKGRRLDVPKHPVSPNLRSLYAMAFRSGGTGYPPLFPGLVRNVPKDRLPAEDILSVLTTQGGSLISVRRESCPNPDDPGTPLEYYAFQVRAPTVERAKELVEALLVLYDYGLSYPVQQEYLQLGRDAEKELPKLRDASEKAQQELARTEKQLEALKDFEDLGEETLVDFRTQLRLISVDMAGTKARIDACNKILAGRKDLGPSRIEQVETVKITAEIELVGLAARKDAIEKIVELGQRRVELFNQTTKLRHDAVHARGAVSDALNKTAEYETARKQYEPFPIQDAKVVIHPIRWEQPK